MVCLSIISLQHLVHKFYQLISIERIRTWVWSSRFFTQAWWSNVSLLEWESPSWRRRTRFSTSRSIWPPLLSKIWRYDNPAKQTLAAIVILLIGLEPPSLANLDKTILFWVLFRWETTQLMIYALKLLFYIFIFHLCCAGDWLFLLRPGCWRLLCRSRPAVPSLSCLSPGVDVCFVIFLFNACLYNVHCTLYKIVTSQSHNMADGWDGNQRNHTK